MVARPRHLTPVLVALLALPPVACAPFRIEGTLTAGGRTYRGTQPPASWPGLRRQR